MEDLSIYIASGVLELYVLGDLSPEERLQVETMAHQFPEIRVEIMEIELALEAFAISQKRVPVREIRDKVLNNINKTGTLRAGIPALQSERSYSYKYAFAASVALLLISWFALFVLYSSYQHSQKDLALLQQSNLQFSNEILRVNSQLDQNLSIITALKDPRIKLITLKGKQESAGNYLTLAFNSSKKLVMIDLSNLQLPLNDARHQYQLWAIVAGNPVDLGLFDLKESSGGMKIMKSVTDPEAFAVTLEQRGGSLQPTMDNLIVIGTI